MILQTEFQEIVKSELSKRNWSGRELARRMEVDSKYVSKYLTGKISPGPDVIERFFNALDLVPHLSGSPK